VQSASYVYATRFLLSASHRVNIRSRDTSDFSALNNLRAATPGRFATRLYAVQLLTANLWQRVRYFSALYVVSISIHVGLNWRKWFSWTSARYAAHSIALSRMFYDINYYKTAEKLPIHFVQNTSPCMYHQFWQMKVFKISCLCKIYWDRRISIRDLFTPQYCGRGEHPHWQWDAPQSPSSQRF